MHNPNKDNSTESSLANEIGFNDVDIYITNPLYFRYTDAQVNKQVQLDAFVDNFEINKEAQIRLKDSVKRYNNRRSKVSVTNPLAATKTNLIPEALLQPYTDSRTGAKVVPTLKPDPIPPTHLLQPLHPEQLPSGDSAVNYLEYTSQELQFFHTGPNGEYLPNHQGGKPFAEDVAEAAVAKCVRSYLRGKYESATYYRGVQCGREWCVTCGAKGSISHRRRVHRVRNKLFTFGDVGYTVFTMPKCYWNYCGKDELSYLNSFLTRMLKRELGSATFDCQGETRWHWAGEDGIRYFPHLNVIHNTAFIDADKLKRLRLLWSRCVKRCFKASKLIPCVVNHSYIKASEPDHDIYLSHLIKYVMRATYKGENQKVRDIITGFINCRTFGFTKENTPELSNSFISKLEAMDQDLIIIPEKEGIVWEKKPVKQQHIVLDILETNPDLQLESLSGKKFTLLELFSRTGCMYIGAGLFTNRKIPPDAT
jgi:hypothetical protein